MNRLTNKEIMFFGLMLFSMLFGAGNLIFPAYLGQAAGENVWQGIVGFIISDAGLALLGFIAIAKSGTFEVLAGRVHAVFAFLFSILIYLSLGPGLAIPRAGSLAYEMGVKPFLPSDIASSPMSLFIYTVVFFSIVFWFAKSPSKLADRMGKILTPALLILILIVFIKSLFTDLPDFGKAMSPYNTNSFSRGIIDGYQTMDGLCALIYGILFTNIFKEKKVSNASLQVKYLVLFGLISGLLLTFCYLIIAYLGAAASIPGNVDNGAIVLSAILQQLFGQSGIIVLGMIFTLACLNVCIGLITSCAQYFSSVFSKISYIKWAVLLCIVSGLVANLGLSQILKVSVPILGVVYPISITLIAFGLFHDRLRYHSRPVYVMTISFVGIYSLIDMMNVKSITHLLSFVPLQDEGFGWIIPGLIGLVLGSLYEKLTASKSISDIEAA